MHARTAASFVLLLHLHLAHADDGNGLRRGAKGDDVGISGVSSGAAMALQYAVAHSASVAGVGSIAGPSWGCANGFLVQAVNNCMCGRLPAPPTADIARKLAGEGRIDPLVSGRPAALKRAYWFQSSGDETVKERAGEATLAFLRDFVGPQTVEDRGTEADGSNVAEHGIISPDGPDPCHVEGERDTYVRKCGAEDNAGKLLLALKAPGTSYDARNRKTGIPPGDVWEFRQLPIIEAVKSLAGPVSSDTVIGSEFMSPRRRNFDMADTGYLYVPPVCRQPGKCGVHVALHGCRQDARQFATDSGYNNWAEHYRLIIVYPAIAPDARPLSGKVCQPAWLPTFDKRYLAEANPNGCWDWWGYLEAGYPYKPGYYLKNSPQLQVIRRIVDEVTRPIPDGSPGGEFAQDGVARPALRNAPR